jgi:uncharacterized membrane protein
MRINDRITAAAAYVFWVPSLYIVLTDKRREGYVGFHGCQALLLWTGIFMIFFLIRFLVNLVWSFYYLPYLDLLEVLTGAGLWGYVFYCGIRSFRGLDFRIPH